MHDEQEKVHFDDLANIWRDAEHCRSHELFAWLKDVFRDRRQFKARPERIYPTGRPAIIK